VLGWELFLKTLELFQMGSRNPVAEEIVLALKLYLRATSGFPIRLQKLPALAF
jgi:hypothetical protein